MGSRYPCCARYASSSAHATRCACTSSLSSCVSQKVVYLLLVCLSKDRSRPRRLPNGGLRPRQTSMTILLPDLTTPHRKTTFATQRTQCTHCNSACYMPLITDTPLGYRAPRVPAKTIHRRPHHPPRTPSHPPTPQPQHKPSTPQRLLSICPEVVISSDASPARTYVPVSCAREVCVHFKPPISTSQAARNGACRRDMPQGAADSRLVPHRTACGLGWASSRGRHVGGGPILGVE